MPSADALLTPDDGTILIGLITVLGWVAWLVFTVSVASELIALVSRQRIRISLPGLAGPQRIGGRPAALGDRVGCGSAVDPGSAEPDGGRDPDQAAGPRAGPSHRSTAAPSIPPIAPVMAAQTGTPGHAHRPRRGAGR